MRQLRDFLATLARASRKSPILEEPQRFLLLSIVIGIFSGLFVVCFHISIEFLNWFTIHSPMAVEHYYLALWPALGGLIAYALVHYVVPTARGTGVNYTKAAVYASDGYIPFRSVLGKFGTCTLSIGTGNPMGPEDPALQMGAGIASLLGRVFHLTRDHMRLIAPIGAAAGIGAAFNTPITAVLFVMEEVVEAWNAGVLGSIVLSSVSAVVVSRWFLGDEPLYRVPAFDLVAYSELAVYAVIGAAGGYLSALFARYVIRLRGRALRLADRFKVWLPAAAGLVVGIVGVTVPETLGAGYEVIDGALNDRFPWDALLLFGTLKLVTLALCFSCGTPGGLFAPTLFVGAMLGGGLGGLAHLFWPLEASSTGAYVLVGMGTFFAGVFRAPMTSVFMVFELSASYEIILPVMIANTVSILVSRRLHHESIFQLAAFQDGLDLPSVEERREIPVMNVEDAMRRGRERIVSDRATVSEALAAADRAGGDAVLVEVPGGQWGWLARRDMERAAQQGKGSEPVPSALRPRSVIRTHPDLPIDQALRKLAVYPLLPVASRVNPSYMVGTLSLEDVHRAYGIAQQERPAGGARGAASAADHS